MPWLLQKLLEWLMAWFPAPEPPIHIDFTFGPVSERPMPQKERVMATLILKDSQQALVSIAPKSKAGNPASVDGVPVWVSSDDTVVTVEAAADGLSALVKTVGPVGVATVAVTADADLGEGVKTFGDSFNVSVEGGEAAGLGFSFGTPEEKPEPPVE